MSVKDVEDAMKATPFIPFDIHLDNGKTVHVRHPDFLLFNESKTGIVVAADERFHIMAVDHISSLSYPDQDFAKAGEQPSQ